MYMYTYICIYMCICIYNFLGDYVLLRYADNIHDPTMSFLLQTKYAQFLPLALCHKIDFWFY